MNGHINQVVDCLKNGKENETMTKYVPKVKVSDNNVEYMHTYPYGHKRGSMAMYMFTCIYICYVGML